MRDCRRYLTVTLLTAAVTTVLVTGCSEAPNLSISLQPGRQQPAAPPPVSAPPSIAVQSPGEGDVIREDVYDGMAGTVSGLQPGQQLFTFARDRFRNWHLQYPPVEVRQGRFEQTNVRLQEGSWELVVCAASDEASRYLHSCARGGRYSFHASEMPEGVVPLTSVKLRRE